MIVFVDSCIWIDYLRGDLKVADKLNYLSDSGRIAIAAPVRIEILSGVKKGSLSSLKKVLDRYPTVFPVTTDWLMVEEWAIKAASKGDRLLLGDLMIAAIAYAKNALIWTADSDFIRMSEYGFVKLYK